VGKASHPDHDDGAEPVLTFEELAEAVKHAPPPTDDEQNKKIREKGKKKRERN